MIDLDELQRIAERDGMIDVDDGALDLIDLCRRQQAALEYLVDVYGQEYPGSTAEILAKFKVEQ